MNELTVRLTIELDGGELIRVGYSMPRDQLTDAMQPLHIVSEQVWETLDNQDWKQREVIRIARHQVAKYITADIANYLVNEVFNKNDTVNGYKIGAN